MGITTGMKEELREAGVRVNESCNLGPLSTLFMERISPEQRQDDQREAAQMGLCFMLGKESTRLLFPFLGLVPVIVLRPTMGTGLQSLSEVGLGGMSWNSSH